MSPDTIWALAYLAVGITWVAICRWWLRKQRRTAHPPWFEVEMRQRQLEREERESRAIGWRR